MALPVAAVEPEEGIMDRLLTDVRFGARFLRKNPGFTFAAVVVLGLGIGSATAIFSVVDHILLRPLPIPASERLVTFCETHETLRGYCSVSMVNVREWAERSGAIEAAGFGRGWPLDVKASPGEAPLAVGTGYADDGFMRAVGFRPLLGRLFTEDDVPPLGDGRSVLIGEDLWRTRFGGDPAIIGRTLLVDEEPFRVVGVLPAWAVAPRLEWIQLWAAPPWDVTDEEQRGWRGFVGVGRLAADVELEAARAELAAIQAGLAEEHPESVRGWGVEVRSMRDFVVGTSRPMLIAFLGAVGALLLIVCVNMAGLLLARATARQRELVVRSALGADAGTLGRQLLTESGLLALIGGAAGVMLAFWATDVFLALAPAGIPRLDEVAVDGRVLAFAVGITALTGLLVGAAPALHSRSVDLAHVLREARTLSSGRGATRLRKALVVTEVALAVMLVAGAGLLGRSFAGLLDWQPGFRTDGLVTFFTSASQGKHPERAQVRALWRHVEEEIAALPGVRSVATGSTLPLFGGGDGGGPVLIGDAPEDVEGAPVATWIDAGPGYFETLGIAVRRGRTFAESDEAGAAPVAIVNETMARRFWPDGDPIGSMIRMVEEGREGEVIGVVADVPSFYPGEAVDPVAYFPNRQYTRWGTAVLVRTDRDGGPAPDVLAAALTRADPDLRAGGVATMEEAVGRRLVGPRFNLLLVGGLAFVALVLAAVGLYGVIAFTVGLRRHEIGIRMALGARREQVLRAILREGAALVAAGLVVGLLATAASSRLLAGMLFGIAPGDPVALLATVLLLLVVGLAASLVPARRASRADPLSALREE